MPYNSYPARTFTFAASNQVAAANLNDIQDGIVLVSENLDDLSGRLSGETATCNTTDAPAPDAIGGVTRWVEKSTNGVNVVVLDTSVDWRDRMVIVFGSKFAAADPLPGGADDDVAEWNFEDFPYGRVHGIFYTQAGQTGASAVGTLGIPFLYPTAGGVEFAIIFARDTDGALCMRKNAHAADGDFYFIVKVDGSPVQNHY